MEDAMQNRFLKSTFINYVIINFGNIQDFWIIFYLLALCAPPLSLKTYVGTNGRS